MTLNRLYNSNFSAVLTMQSSKLNRTSLGKVIASRMDGRSVASFVATFLNSSRTSQDRARMRDDRQMLGNAVDADPRSRGYGACNSHVMHRANNDGISTFEPVDNGTPDRSIRDQRPQ